MMHHLTFLIRVTSFTIALTLLLTVFVGPAHASETSPTFTYNSEQPEDTELISLALVGGTALLASGVLMGKLRSMLS
ncbi:MAG: hypothetical protein V3S14_02235 [Anaerolineae bacterium]